MQLLGATGKVMRGWDIGGHSLGLVGDHNPLPSKAPTHHPT